MQGWAGNYDKKWLSGDVAAGLSVGSIIVAQGMAYAVIANVPAIYGLYASLVSLILYGFLGTCGQLSVAPVAILALIVREGQHSKYYYSLVYESSFYTYKLQVRASWRP